MSFRTKLFIITIFIVSASLSSIITLEVNYIKKLLTSYYNSILLEEAQALTSEVDKNIELALAQHSGAFTTLLNTKRNQRLATANKYILANKRINYLDIFLLRQNSNPIAILDHDDKLKNHGILTRAASRKEIKDVITLDNEPNFIVSSKNDLPNGEKLLFITLFNYTSIIPPPSWNSSKKSFIVHSDEHLLSNLDIESKEFATNITKRDFRQILKTNGITGVKKDSNNYIVSYSSSKLFPFTVFIWNSLDQIGGIIRKETLRQVSLVLAILFATIIVVYIFSSTFTRNIRKISKRMERAAEGDLETKIIVKSKDEIGKLAHTFNWMMENLDKLQQKEIEFIRTESELETAQLIQSGLIPNSSIDTPNTRIHSYYQAMSKCGGDWWSHYLYDNRYEYICIADATGHGPSAAIVTAIAFTVFSEVKKEIEEFDSIIPPKEIITRMNQVMAQKNMDGITMTAAIIFIDHKKQILQYVNGGHTPIFYVKDKQVKALLAPGYIVGYSKKPIFGEIELPLEDISRLLIYTDGLNETYNTNGKLFGYKNIKRILKSNLHLSQKDFIEKLYTECEAFRDNHPRADDYTVVAVDIKKNMVSPPPPTVPSYDSKQEALA